MEGEGSATRVRAKTVQADSLFRSLTRGLLLLVAMFWPYQTLSQSEASLNVSSALSMFLAGLTLLGGMALVLVKLTDQMSADSARRTHVAGLYAIVYPDHPAADAAFETLKGLEAAGFLTIMDQALVRKSASGEVSVDEEKHPVRRGVVTGGVLGAIAGTMFFAPIAGAAVGAAIGGVIGQGNRSGGEDDFAVFSKTVQQELPPGGAAIVVLGSTDARDRVVQNLGSHGGKVYSFDITDEKLAEVQREIDRAAGS